MVVENDPLAVNSVRRPAGAVNAAKRADRLAWSVRSRPCVPESVTSVGQLAP